MNNQGVNNLCEKKNQIQDLLQDIFNEYNRMNESKIQNNCEKDLEMRTMIDTIRTLETSETQKTNEIRSLKKTIHEYETLINTLNSKLETVEEDKNEENRFDMVRIQAKEITEKDREIERLNGLLNHYKKKNKDSQIDTVLNVVENSELSEITLTEVDENEDSNTGENNPNFVYEDKVSSSETASEDKIKDDSVLEKPIHSEPSPGGSIQSEVDDTKVDDSGTDIPEVDKGKLIIVTSKKIKYYAYEKESPQTVYEFNGNKIADKPLGTRIKNEKGKYKIQLFAS
tara:strand:- start:665 stop:1519 length:855 start_codon:yes stop_codon:yes gene_type:complete